MAEAAAGMMMSETDEKVMNIDDLPSDIREKVYLEVGKRLCEENLAYVNAHSAPAHPKRSFYAKYGKRCLDLLISAVALIVLLPINLLIGVCTYFDVGRPIFFRQTRIGKDGIPFTIVKFRNMTNETDANGVLLPPGQRVTRFGKFVRKTSLDELLNFWSIFKGDMSVVGPRPLPERYVSRYSERHKARLAVRPGLECPMIHKQQQRDSWGAQFENDVYYAEHVSLALDIKMLFLIVKMVFDPKSSSMRSEVTRGSFMGYDTDGRSIVSKKVPLRFVADLVHTEDEEALLR